MTENEIAELITRRRRQILVHSVIYYEMNDSLISDNTWSQWAVELEKLQKTYPDISAKCPYAKAFSDFDPSTGYNLPLGDLSALSVARRLIRYRNEHF